MEADLISYIIEAKNHGLTDVEIKQNLLNAGWEANAVEENFVHAKSLENKQISSSTASGAPISDAQKYSVFTQGPALHTSTIQGDNAEPAASFVVNKNPLKNSTFWVSLLILIILAGGAYSYFVYAQTNPEKIWTKFYAIKKNPIYSANFSVSYSDPGTSIDGIASATPVTLNLSGSGYNNLSDLSSPQFSTTLSAGITSPTSSGSKDFKIIYLDKVIYINLSSLSDLQSLTGGQKLDWIKIDFKKLEDTITQQASPPDLQAANNLQTKAQDQLKELWGKTHIVKVTKYLGTEKIGTTNTFHLQNDLDKQALTDGLNKTIDILSDFRNPNLSTSTPNEIKDQTEKIKAVITKFVMGIQVNKFETWIGKSNFQLYKINFESNFPAISKLAESSLLDSTPLGVARIKSRDAKRATDMRQLSSVLELYFNDTGGYPSGLNGVPQNLTPNYIAQVPIAPNPADGSCTNYYNSYWYQPTGKAFQKNGKTLYPSYEYTFCLGADSTTTKAGIAKMTPKNTQSGLPCTGSGNQCVKTADQAGMDVALDFGGKLTFGLTYSDYGKIQQLTPPGNALDVFDLFKGIMPAAQSKTN